LNTVISLIDISEKEILLSYLKTYLLEIEQDTDYAYLDSYWTDKNRIPLKLTNGKNLLGFALINDYTITPTNTIALAEFYILPEYRNQGLGMYFINEILQNYNGNWEIRTQISNKTGIQFWDKVVSKFTNNIFKMNQINNEIIYSFVSKR
jgi:predicted acetyltransferase